MCTFQVSQPGPLLEKPSDRLGRYDFHHSDAIVDWALKHDMKVKGHVLVWHVTSPAFLEDLEPEEIREQLRRHIFTTMGHYRGRIAVWDVVNEALAPDGTLADTVFLRKLGPSYIEQAFRWAHEADPGAILLYNDNKVEGMNGPNALKANGFYRLLAGLKKKNVPVHGCGIQAHFNAAGIGRNRPPTPQMVKNQIHRLGKLGLSVNISVSCWVSRIATIDLFHRVHYGFCFVCFVPC
jgi:endo-1,4-beta-xylanase